MKNKGLPFLLLISASLLWMGCGQKTSVKLEKHDITEAVYASGYVIAENEYKVYALGDGQILKRPVEAGDSVYAGQVLFEIQNDAQNAKAMAAERSYENAITNAGENSPVLEELRNRIRSAQDKFSNDSLNYFRYKALYEKNAIAKIDYDRAKLSYTMSFNDLSIAKETYNRNLRQVSVESANASSALTSSKIDLSNYQVRSQINGRVFELYKELGEVVRRNDQVALIGDASKRIIKLSVDQQDIQKLQVGQVVLIKSDVSGEKIMKAKVEKIYPNMNQNDQTFRVDARFDDDVKMPYIHTSVEANIIIAEKKGVMVLPRSVVDAEDMILVKGEKKKRKIAVGLSNTDFVEVISGVNVDEEVMIPEEK